MRKVRTVNNMVIKSNPEHKCDRCGAVAREDRLTVSHVPHKKLMLIVTPPADVAKRLQRVYILCEKCRRVHHELEQRLLTKACADIAQLHEDYLNQ